jgi:hypothetical protein
MTNCDTREELQILVQELNTNIKGFVHNWRKYYLLQGENTVSYKEKINLKQYILYRDTRFEILTTVC